jgi:serine/threonine-protein kinase
VLYEMLVGEPPFTGGNPQLILARKSIEMVPPVSMVRETVSPALEHTVQKALAKVPADRYRTGAEFITALDQAEASPAAGAWEGSRRPARRRLAIAALVLALSAAAVMVPFALKIGPFAGLSAEPLRSVAVLPFANETGDPEHEYLIEGISEMLIGQLVQVPGLERVISQASALTYKGREVDAVTVAQDLDVAVVVTGAMQLDGEQWTLAVTATDAVRNQPLWGDTAALTLDELTAAPARLARAIPEAMHLDVPEGVSNPTGARVTADPEAQRLYLRAQHLMTQYTDESLTQAVDYLEQALDRDPAYALAYSGLAQVHSMIALFALEPPSAIYPQAKRAAQRALRLDDQLAEAHVAMGAVLMWFDWDWEAAERELRRAVQLSPRNPTAQAELGGFLAAMDRADEAIEVARRYRDLDPVSASANMNVAWTHFVLGQYEQALEEAQATLELFPTDAGTYRQLALALSKLERADEAVAAAQRAELLGEVSTWALASLGRMYAESGRPDLARRNLEQLNALARERFVDPQYFAVLYAGLGDTQRALQWLERAYDNRSPNLVCKCDSRSNFANLASHPRYQELRARMNYPVNE